MQALKRIESTEQETNIAVFLAENNIHCEIRLLGTDIMRGDNWKCDQWSVVFTTNTDTQGRRLSNGHRKDVSALAERFDYYTGTGHRRAPRKKALSFMDNSPVPQYPEAASVLYSLLLDASAEDENLHDWCSNYGYDPDSKKATKMYEDCLDEAKKLHRIFTREQLATLRELLEDY